MKRSKIMLGLAALLFAGVGAFASINKDPETVFYLDNEGCESTVLETQCDVGTTPNCSELIPGLGALRQIYQDSICQTPFEREVGF